MSKLFASIKKEFLLLIYDKVGLLLMYLMPIFLVFVITIVQDSTFKLVNENNIEISVVNNDKGNLGDSLLSILHNSGSFEISENKGLSKEEIKTSLLNNNHLLTFEIPSGFTAQLTLKAQGISRGMLQEFGILDADSINKQEQFVSPLNIYYDPVLQESFRYSIISSIYSFLGALENRLMIESLYKEMGYDEIPTNLEAQFIKNRIEINQIAASSSSEEITPNSAQHNVPAWSIFAMFFMVISLGGIIVKERLSGSFIRLQTIPSSFVLVLMSKVIVYLFVAISQLAIIFLLGKFLFPLIGLPSLSMPTNTIGLIIVSSFSALAAISFAMLVGTYAKTVEQASGFGAITIIIFAAIGGIWVPSFVMPAYLQTIGKISPLHWCLEGYYTLFLKGGDWALLIPTFIFLGLFIAICNLLIYLKLKSQNYV